MINAPPKASRMILAMRSCCVKQQWTSAEIVTGYGDVTNEYFAIASQTSFRRTLVVRVRLWYTTGSVSPSKMSTKSLLRTR